MDVVMAAGKEVCELVHEQDGEKRQSKGQAADKGRRMAIQESESVEEFIEGERFAASVGDRELCAGDEASYQRQEKQGEGDEKRF